MSKGMDRKKETKKPEEKRSPRQKPFSHRWTQMNTDKENS